jgi:hypothetical protein
VKPQKPKKSKSKINKHNQNIMKGVLNKKNKLKAKKLITKQ